MFTKELHNFGILAQILWANLLLYFVYSSSDLILKKNRYFGASKRTDN